MRNIILDSTRKTDHPPTIDEVRKAQNALRPHLVVTPVSRWVGAVIDSMMSVDTEIFAKLEIHQYSGSFKARAALLHILQCSDEQRVKGVVAVSAGNHAIAVSFAAQQLKTSAKVIMPKSVSKIRLKKCKMRGAEVILVDSFADAFLLAEQISKDEGRLFIHPFEGKSTAIGTGTLGAEFYEQVNPGLDAVVVSVGGGGLAAGVSTSIKHLNPDCAVYGVEPEGAASISRSIAKGSTVTLDSVDTIANSLAAPYSLPYSFELCRENIDRVCLVSDQQMCEAMAFLFYEMKLAVEPACAAVVAAIFGPLRQELLGKRVGILLCGSSIDADVFSGYIRRGEAFYNSIVESA